MNIALFGINPDPKWNVKIDFLLNAIKNSGAQLFYYRSLYDYFISSALPNIPTGEIFTCAEDLPADISLFLALGGDGTFLNSLTIIKNSNIPIAGINFGRLGFLTTARVSGSDDAWIDSLLKGEYNIEKRSVLKLQADGIPSAFYPYALNEITIQRSTPYMIGIELKINGERIPTYWADGLLISTPTGSTAYSMSVGGPIVTPGSNVFIIAPISPHNLNVRPLIVHDSSHLEVKVISKSENAILTVDNRSFNASSDDTLHLSKADFNINNVYFSKSGFFDALKEKLLWGEDKRNCF
jgi:NAD+ kinase